MWCSGVMMLGMWWLVVLGTAVTAAAAADVSWLNRFGETLHSELTGVLDAAETKVQYYKAVINTTYVSEVEFDMRAMGPLYNSTEIVIDFIANKQAYPEGIVSVADGHVDIAPLSEHKRDLAQHYAGPAALLALALLLAAALPLAGLFWCCCYWCRTGRRRRPFDRKYDSCLKGILAILLIGLLTLFLFGVVCAFATDEQVERSAREFPAAFRGGVRDVRHFLNATQAHYRWLLVVNYRQLEEQLLNLVNNSGVRVSEQLGEFSRAVSVTTLHRMVQQLGGVQADLRAVRNYTDALRYNAERLNAGLRKVRGDLLNTLRNCDQPQCRHLQEKYKIGELYTEIQYNQMPDVSSLLQNVTRLVDSDIQQEVGRGQRVFEDIRAGVQSSVARHRPALLQAVTAAGERLEQMSARISALAHNASTATGAHGDAAAEWMEQHGSLVLPYLRYVGLATATALLLMTALLALGLLCGVCGKRPDVYGASDCCNKGAGSRSLLCGTALMFVAGGGVALVLAAHFALGLVAQRFICDPLLETGWEQNNRMFGDVEKFVDLEGALFNEHRDPGFNLSAVLRRCHRNQTIYTTLSLHRVYDVESLQSELEAEISRRLSALRPEYPGAGKHVVILQESAKEKLRQLAETGLSDFNFDRILEALETNITSLSLEELARQLERTATELRARAGFMSVTINLQNCAATLRAFHADIVAPLAAHTAALNKTAINLRDGLRFNHSSLKEAVAHLMLETEQAELFLNTQGPQLIHNLTVELGESVATPLKEYLAMLAHATRHQVGRCGPLSHVYNSTVRDALCHKMFMPVNGYWMSLSWCVLLFVPIMVVAVRLARLYLHLDPYPGPLVEAEYLYDAYADRDNVPLANGSKRSTLDIEGKIAEWKCRATAPPASPGEGGGGGGEGGAGGGSRTQLLLEGGGDVVCQLVPAALIDDLKTRLDCKDEDNESGIHESDAYKADKRIRREPRGGGGPADAGLAGAAGAAGPDARASTHIDAHHARRYNDMAPKHWEEGPPRYHGPTEYERPPPYYYPGPVDRQ